MKNLDRLQPWSLLIMRIAAGAIVIDHGWRKLHQSGYVLFLASRHWPTWLGSVTAGFEIVVGTLLLVGLLTRWAALATALYMVVAALGGHFPIGHEMQIPAMLFALSLGLLAFGPGFLAAERARPVHVH
ncbi:MAG TPA: DoxX family protein [Terriglobales bacterium]|nr:DoxX family protein [Terriglobales bacterium]